MNPRSEPLGEGTALRLTPGASLFQDFHPQPSAIGSERRAQIRVMVTILDDPRAECVVTLEVFDNESGIAAVAVQMNEDA